METIKIIAELELCSQDDVYCGKNTFENKKLFVKDQFSDKFMGCYTLPQLDNHTYPYDTLEQKKHRALVQDYNKREINNLLIHKMLYKISERSDKANFCFQLVLQLAEEWDVLDTPKFVKPNVIYYLRKNSNEIIGPYTLTEHSSIMRLKAALEQKKIYIIGKQTFQSVQKSLAS